jgi:AbrB family looped-hinge helix DNA binding protein
MEKSFRSRVSSKGQIAISPEIRERLSLKQGDRVEFVAERNGIIVTSARAAKPFAKYVGALGVFPEERNRSTPGFDGK